MKSAPDGSFPMSRHSRLWSRVTISQFQNSLHAQAHLQGLHDIAHRTCRCESEYAGDLEADRHLSSCQKWRLCSCRKGCRASTTRASSQLPASPCAWHGMPLRPAGRPAVQSGLLVRTQTTVALCFQRHREAPYHDNLCSRDVLCIASSLVSVTNHKDTSFSDPTGTRRRHRHQLNYMQTPGCFVCATSAWRW